MKTDKNGKAEFNQAASELCDHYCKWPWIRREMGRAGTIDEEICGKCPLIKLEKGMKVE